MSITPESETWMQIKPVLRRDLSITTVDRNGSSELMIEDSVSGKFFQVGQREYRLLNLLDGKISVAQANQLLASNADCDSFSTDRLKEIFDWAIRTNLLQTASGVHVQRFERMAARQQQQNVTRWFNPFYYRIPLFRPDRVLSRMLPLFGWLFSGMGAILWLILVAFAAFRLSENYEQFQAASTGIVSDGKWIRLIVAAILLKVIHETGHGLACRKFGAEVRDTGLVLMCFMPLAYIDVTSCWRLPNKWQRIAISLGGIFFETMVAATAIIVWSMNPQSVTGDICYNLALMASITTLVFNANPLMRFDGYYVLVDLFNAPNMYGRASVLLKSTIRDWFFANPKHQTTRWSTSRMALLCYGALALWWRIMICVGLVLLAAFMFHGAGIVLAVAAACVWAGKPLYHTVGNVMRNTEELTLRKTRLLGTVCGFACLFAGAVYVSNRPAIITVPGIVEYSPLSIVRAGGPGFLSEVFVDDGQYVNAGDPVAQLQNAELKLRLERLRHELAQTEIRMRLHQRNAEQSLFQTESESADGTRSQIEELETQLARLLIVAPHDGFVVRRNLRELIGVYFHEGDELLVLGDESKKELQLSIDQASIAGLNTSSAIAAKTLVPGQPVFASMLERIDPRGTVALVHPSLAATHGGVLPVREANRSRGDERGDVELLSPHFTGRIALNSETAGNLRTGQRVQVKMRSEQRTLGQQTMQTCRDWWETQIINAGG